MGCNDDVCDIFPEDYIYLITVMQNIEEVVTKSGIRTGIPDFGDTRVVGYYLTYDDARETVVNNAGDIHETIYDYALIEKVAPGIYNGATSDYRSVFKYNKEKERYDPVEEPAFLSNICGIGIG